MQPYTCIKIFYTCNAYIYILTVIHIPVLVHLYVYFVELNMYVCIYVHAWEIYVYIYVCIYINTYIYLWCRVASI